VTAALASRTARQHEPSAFGEARVEVCAHRGRSTSIRHRPNRSSARRTARSRTGSAGRRSSSSGAELRDQARSARRRRRATPPIGSARSSEHSDPGVRIPSSSAPPNAERNAISAPCSCSFQLPLRVTARWTGPTPTLGMDGPHLPMAERWRAQHLPATEPGLAAQAARREVRRPQFLLLNAYGPDRDDKLAPSAGPWRTRDPVKRPL
jgi:hypothetical protein